MSAAESIPQQHAHAVRILYSEHHDWLFGWLRKKLGCAHNAADVAHDTFMRIIASRDALLGVEQPRAWLTTTAKRLIIDRARREVLEHAYLAEMAVLADSLPCHPAPDEILMALEALDQIGAALQAINARAREAFMLHYLDQQTHAAIAVHLGVSVRMVQKYLVQALLACRHRCAALA